jgi:hypothetical protein
MSGSTPSYPGYTNLTPDQAALLQKVGYFMNPDAVLPNGPNGQPQQWQQPTGYSGLNPLQIQAVNQLGYYSRPDVVQPQQKGLIEQAFDKLNSPAGEQAMKEIGQAVSPQKTTVPAPPLPFNSGLGGSPFLRNPYFNIWRHPFVSDPRAALRQFMQGNVSG